MQIAEKWQLPPFRLGMCTDEEPLVELRISRLAGLIRPIQRELFGGARKHWAQSSEQAAEGRASWPLGGSASAKAGPKSSESEAAVCRTSSSPKETKSRAFGLGNRKSCKNSTGEFARVRSGEGGRERKGEACLLTLYLLELDIRTPARGSTRGRDLTRSLGGARCAPGKNGGFPFTILKPRVMRWKSSQILHFEVP